MADLDCERLDALRRYEIMDTDAEPAFDDLTHLASNICQAPIALLTLLDGKRQWFKSAQGIATRETPREFAFCSYAIMERETMVVRDARTDSRFSGNPLVTGEPNIRFYAGAPLVDREGHALGTLCVIDSRPRRLRHSQLAALKALSRAAITLIEARRTARLLAETLVTLQSEIALRNRAEDHTKLLFHTVRIHREISGSEDDLLPICAYCKGIKDEAGLWHRLEAYVAKHANVRFTHGVCPGCYEKEIARLAIYELEQ